MFGFAAKLPISSEEQQWIDEGFRRLEKMLGRSRLLNANVILPNPEFFPDRYDKTPEAAGNLFERVCHYMDVDRDSVEFEVFADETEGLRDLLPYWRGNHGGCAGLYLHSKGDGTGGHSDELPVIAIRSSQLQDPLSLVATVAHELGHLILIGGGHVDSNTTDHEPLTDLVTVFLGLGIFNANSAARFRQFQEESRYGWSMQRLGYLPEEAYGYALARFAQEREDERTDWSTYLSPNIKSYFKRSRAWLARNHV